MSVNHRIYLYFICILNIKGNLLLICQIVLLSSTDVGFAIGGDSGIDYLVLEVHYASVDKFQSKNIIQLNCCIFIITTILFCKILNNISYHEMFYQRGFIWIVHVIYCIRAKKNSNSIAHPLGKQLGSFACSGLFLAHLSKWFC